MVFGLCSYSVMSLLLQCGLKAHQIHDSNRRICRLPAVDILSQFREFVRIVTVSGAFNGGRFYTDKSKMQAERTEMFCRCVSELMSFFCDTVYTLKINDFFKKKSPQSHFCRLKAQAIRCSSEQTDFFITHRNKLD